jgi:two-component system cell cycle response regulator
MGRSRFATARSPLSGSALARAIPMPVLGLLIVLGVWGVMYQLQDTAFPALASVTPFDGYWSDIAFTLAALCLIARGWRGERGWALIGLGALCWAAGDVYWTAKLSHMSSPPVPSWADAGYLLFCPLTFAGILSLVRRRARSASRTLIADAMAAALTTGSLSAALAVQPVLDHAHGGTLAIATNLAYPVSDLALLGLLVGAMALGEWRISRTWLLLGASIVTFWIADTLYLVSVANATYSQGQWYNGLWYISPILAAWAAWLPAAPAALSDVDRGTSVRGITMLLGVAGGALAVLVSGKFVNVGVPAVMLAAGALLVIMARLVMTWRENLRLLRLSQDEAITDSLTGLRNRRALVADLGRQLRSATTDSPLALVLFDLDGFKHYNDNFGHPAGDALLARLGRSLAAGLDGRGEAYRMGGDEFCALIAVAASDLDTAVRAASQALTDSGEGFTIGCSYGSVTLPLEAEDAEGALRIADQRMYAQKRGSRASASRQSGDVLLRLLAERDPVLRTHLHDVAELAAETARSFGLPLDEVEQIRQGAELHDVGKMAIPDAILDKPASLDDSEWAFIRRHTLIGERIINAAPALRRVALLVRASHENFDGTGYPDQLKGEAIPLGARIIAVCDAFDAMTTNRSYRKARSEAEALSELHRCAGTQFDPVVVSRFCAALERSQHDVVLSGVA